MLCGTLPMIRVIIFSLTEWEEHLRNVEKTDLKEFLEQKHYVKRQKFTSQLLKLRTKPAGAACFKPQSCFEPNILE